MIFEMFFILSSLQFIQIKIYYVFLCQKIICVQNCPIIQFNNTNKLYNPFQANLLRNSLLQLNQTKNYSNSYTIIKSTYILYFYMFIIFMFFIYDEIVDVTEYMPCRDSLVPTGFAFCVPCIFLYLLYFVYVCNTDEPHG